MQKPGLLLTASIGAILAGVISNNSFNANVAAGKPNEPPPGKDVRVINSADEAIPVTLRGDTAIRGDVNVANTPNVTVANPVTVIPGLPGIPFGKTGSPGISVPADRHLTVETLSLQVDVTPRGTKIEAFVDYKCNGEDVTLFVPVTYAYTDAGTGFDFYVATQAVRLYADPGSFISVSLATPGGFGGTLFLTASGYLN